MPALAGVAELFTIGLLEALSASTKGLRGFLNELVSLTNEFTGGDIAEFTFGTNLEKEIDGLAFNLQNAHRGLEMTEDGIRQFLLLLMRRPVQIAGFNRATEATENKPDRSIKSCCEGQRSNQRENRCFACHSTSNAASPCFRFRK